MLIKSIILVGLGGGIGSILRYLTSFVCNKYLPSQFPWGTFIVNILGCLLIGILLGLLSRNNSSQDLKLLFITGFCGGYTTFSAFAAENITLIQSNHLAIAILYIAASILAGLLAVWAGLYLVK